jgi:broad specificity phosphatase PhoE
MEEAILARHGETEASLRGAMNGDPRTPVALTERGRAEARRLGQVLAGDELDLCVTSEFGRTQETADLALAGRAVPRLVLPELNDIRVGEFEGRLLVDYRLWAGTHDPLAVPPGGGESRADTVRRYARAFRTLLARPERRILVVAHGLPIRYVLNASRGLPPTPVLDPVGYAHPHCVARAELEQALDRLEEWSIAPAWAD